MKYSTAVKKSGFFLYENLESFSHTVVIWKKQNSKQCTVKCVLCILGGE